MNITQTRGRPASRRRQVLAYVKDCIASDGRAPSYQMICHQTGIATRQEVSRIVGVLESQGRLRRAGVGRVRRIQLV